MSIEYYLVVQTLLSQGRGWRCFGEESSVSFVVNVGSMQDAVNHVDRKASVKERTLNSHRGKHTSLREGFKQNKQNKKMEFSK